MPSIGLLVNLGLELDAMPFAASTVPLEWNTGYIKSSVFSYPTFSIWFDKVKEHLDSQENRTNLKSDRLEAVFDQTGSFFQITLCPSGYGVSTQPVVRAYYESPVSSESVVYGVPSQSGDETLVEVTKRWVLSMHEAMRLKLQQHSVRVRWFSFSFEDDAVAATSPPDLFPPV